MKLLITGILLALSFNVLATDKITKQDAFIILKTINTKKDVIFATLSKDTTNSYIAINKTLSIALETGDEKLISEIIRVAVYVSSIDPSHEVGTHLLPLYETHKKKFDAVLSKYSKKDRKRIITHLDAAKTEGDEGNG